MEGTNGLRKVRRRNLGKEANEFNWHILSELEVVQFSMYLVMLKVVETVDV